jgi:hypothetical protein
MAIRVVCFVAAVVLYAQGLGWLTAIPIVGAIAIPYFAVVFANAGRDASSSKSFRAYEPRLPARYQPPDSDPDPGSGPGTGGHDGAPGENGPSTYPHRTDGH